jgi:hypothetical protein
MEKSFEYTENIREWVRADEANKTRQQATQLLPMSE